MTKFQYRPDIDGLRAVAILVVLFFHAFPAIFSGGFIGVDLFFIISGFLITSKIIEDVDADRFSLRTFYKRRILRLFPGLILVFTCFTAVAWIYFYPPDFENYLKHLFASTLFFSNFTHFFEVNYFAKAAEYKPLLHFWSLAVEEQFYFLWPLLLSLFMRSRHLLRTVIVVMVISFAINVWRVKVDSQEIYYLFHGRFWELLMGSALALSLKNKSPGFDPLLRNSFSLGGMFLLITAFFVISKHFYPGWWALLPTTGTALVILAGPEAWLNKRILSARPIVYVGKISYPIYLWHWPLLSFGIICGVNETKHIWMFLALCVVLAILTHEFLERPLKRIQNKSRLSSVLLSLNIAIAILAGFAYKKKFLPLNSDDKIMSIFEASRDWYPFPENLKIVNPQDQLRYFEFGEGKEVILLAGDSHLQMYIPWFQKKADLKRYKFYVVSEGGCPFIPNVKSEIQPEKDMCPDLVKLAATIGNIPEVSKIIIVTGWTNYLTQETRFYHKAFGDRVIPGSEPYNRALKELENYLKAFVKKGKKVFLFGTIAMGEAFVPELFLKRDFPSPKGKIVIPEFDLEAFLRGHNKALNDASAVASNAGATWVDPLPHYCPDGNCEVVTKDMEPVYWNHAHIRPFYIIEHSDFFRKILEAN